MAVPSSWVPVEGGAVGRPATCGRMMTQPAWTLPHWEWWSIRRCIHCGSVVEGKPAIEIIRVISIVITFCERVKTQS